MTRLRKVFIAAAAFLFVTGSASVVVENLLGVEPTKLGPYTGPFGGLEIAAAVICLVLAIDPDRIQTALLSRIQKEKPPAPPQEPPAV